MNHGSACLLASVHTQYLCVSACISIPLTSCWRPAQTEQLADRQRHIHMLMRIHAYIHPSMHAYLHAYVSAEPAIQKTHNHFKQPTSCRRPDSLTNDSQKDHLPVKVWGGAVAGIGLFAHRQLSHVSKSATCFCPCSIESNGFVGSTLSPRSSCGRLGTERHKQHKKRSRKRREKRSLKPSYASSQWFLFRLKPILLVSSPV